MSELPADQIYTPDYKKWLQRTCWTFRTKHWWETELILLSCDIDPDRTHFNLVNDLLEYAAVPNSHDNRLDDAKLRFDLIVRAISCGNLVAENIDPPDHSNPETIYLINAVKFLQWLKSVELSYPSGFDHELQTPDNQVFEDSPTRLYELDKNDRLEGWKQIAAFFGYSPKTIHRWEEYDPPIPVKRAHNCRVFGSKQELSKWFDDNNISQIARRTPSQLKN